MASFIETLEAASATSTSTSTAVATASMESTSIAAYSEEEFTQSDKYDWYVHYYDNKYSSIDTQKKITLNPNHPNLTQEENSQVIPFEMDRFYDGFDLSKTFIQFHFVNVDGYEGFSIPINVAYSDTRIRFSWLVSAEATALAGKLKFEIIATGTNEKGNTYVWRTRPNEDLIVLESLVGNGVIEPTSGWDSYIEQINTKLLQAQNATEEAKTAASQATKAAATVDTKIANASSSITATVLENIAEELSNYYTKTEVDSIISVINVNIADLQTKVDEFDGLAALGIEYDPDADTITYYNGSTVIKKITLDMTPSATWIESYNALVDSKISAANETLKKELQDEFDAKLEAIDVSDQFVQLENKIADEYYNKEQIDTKLTDKADATTVAGLTNRVGAVESTANSNKTSIATQPVYFSSGKPVACTYTLGKSVPRYRLIATEDV